MADKKDVAPGVVFEKAARLRVEFWASTIDAFFQDFLDKAGDNDKLGTIVAAARLAQLGECISREYEANCGGLCESKTEVKAAQQAAVLVNEMCEKNAERCQSLIPAQEADGALLLTGTGDRSLN